MPGLLKKEEPTLALTYEVEENDNNVVQPAQHQPRQPFSLEGLLRYAVEAAGDASSHGGSPLLPLDDERRRFLENALRSMTIDVIELLVKQINVFRDIQTKQLTEDSDVGEYLDAFATIFDYVDNIDVANDFHKIKGTAIVKPCLNVDNSKIRMNACELIAELCQNNPYCQRVAIEYEFLESLIEMLNRESDEVNVKVLYAIGGIIRENEYCLRTFEDLNGLESLVTVFKNKHDKLRTKAAFLMDSISRMRAETKQKLVSLDLIPVIVSILNEEHMESHEYVVSLLKTLVEDNPPAAATCRSPDVGLRDVLRSNMAFAKDKEEFNDEYRHYEELMNNLFKD